MITTAYCIYDRINDRFYDFGYDSELDKFIKLDLHPLSDRLTTNLALAELIRNMAAGQYEVYRVTFDKVQGT